MTLIFGGILSFVYGLFCGVLSFCLVWIGTPFMRAWFIGLGMAGKLWLFIVKCFYEPYFESCGLIFSRMKMDFNNRSITQNV